MRFFPGNVVERIHFFRIAQNVVFARDEHFDAHFLKSVGKRLLIDLVAVDDAVSSYFLGYAHGYGFAARFAYKAACVYKRAERVVEVIVGAMVGGSGSVGGRTLDGARLTAQVAEVYVIGKVLFVATQKIEGRHDRHTDYD